MAVSKAFQKMVTLNCLKPLHYEMTATYANSNGSLTLATAVWSALQQHMVVPTNETSLLLIHTFLYRKDIEMAREVAESMENKTSDAYLRAYARILAAELRLDDLIKHCQSVPDSDDKAKETALHMITKVVDVLDHPMTGRKRSHEVPAVYTVDPSLSTTSSADALKYVLSELHRLKKRPTREIVRHWIRSVKDLESAIKFLVYSTIDLGHRASSSTFEKLISSIEGPQIGLAWQLCGLYKYGVRLSPSARLVRAAFSISARETNVKTRCVFETVLLRDLVDHWKASTLEVQNDSIPTANLASIYAQTVRDALPNYNHPILQEFIDRPSGGPLSPWDRDKLSAIVYEVARLIGPDIHAFKVSYGTAAPKTLLNNAIKARLSKKKTNASL